MATVNYSCVLIDNKEYPRAINILKTEYNKNSQNYLVYNNLGYAYFLTERYQSALESYTLSIELEKNNPLAYCNRGNLIYNILNDDDGIKDLLKSYELGDYEAGMILQTINTKNCLELKN